MIIYLLFGWQIAILISRDIFFSKDFSFISFASHSIHHPFLSIFYKQSVHLQAALHYSVNSLIISLNINFKFIFAVTFSKIVLVFSYKLFQFFNINLSISLSLKGSNKKSKHCLSELSNFIWPFFCIFRRKLIEKFHYFSLRIRDDLVLLIFHFLIIIIKENRIRLIFFLNI